MRALKALIIIFTSLMMIACSSGDDDAPVDRLSYKNEDLAKLAISNFKLQCKDKNKCNESVGGLVYAETVYKAGDAYVSTGSCSLTLIEKNKILTNRHCLPRSVKQWGASCDSMGIMFPETKNKKSQKVKCKKIEMYSTKKPGSPASVPDWAIIELSEDVNRKVIANNPKGVPSGDTFSMYPATYNASKLILSNGQKLTVFSGYINKVNCLTSNASMYNPLYVTSKSPTFSANCDADVVVGNSGSGFINKQQELVAVFSFGPAIDIDIDVFGQVHEKKVTQIGGTNLYCIEYFNKYERGECKAQLITDSLKYYLTTTMLNGSYLDEPTKENFYNLMNDQLMVDWKDNTENLIFDWQDHFFAKDIIEDLGLIEGERYTRELLSKTLPRVPQCFHEDLIGQKNYIVKVPYLESDFTTAELDTDLHLKLSYEIRELGFNVNYDSSSNTFNMSLVQEEVMPDLSDAVGLFGRYSIFDWADLVSAAFGDQKSVYELLESYLLNTHLMTKYLGECFVSGTSEGCETAKQLKSDRHNLVIEANFEHYQVTNYLNIMSKAISADYELKVPVCN